MSSSSIKRRYSLICSTGEGGHCIDDNAPEGQDDIGMDLTDEDINTDTGMATPTEPAQAPPGPITRARARELNFMMILKNVGPEVT